MKNTFKILFTLIIVTSLVSCAKEEGTIYDVLDYETGAVLRTISVENALLNSSEPTSEFIVTVEEQDEQDGALLESVDIYVSLRDLTSDNGTAEATDKYIKTYDASDFTTGPVGLPRATLSSTYSEAFNALGLSETDISPGDLFVMELRLNLTDGRTFGKNDAGGIITGGFFSSTFQYNVLVVCSPEPGTYTLDMQDAYGDGWQSNGMVVTIDGVSTSYGAGSQNGGSDFYTSSVDIEVPVGTSSLSWNWPGDSYPSEVTYQIYGPGDILLGAFKGDANIDDYGCGCSIVEVDGVPAQVASAGLQPVLLCAN
jgi:hypothetical protein